MEPGTGVAESFHHPYGFFPRRCACVLGVQQIALYIDHIFRSSNADPIIIACVGFRMLLRHVRNTLFDQLFFCAFALFASMSLLPHMLQIPVAFCN